MRKIQRIVYGESRKDLQTGKEKMIEKVYPAFIVYIRRSEECKVRDLAFKIKTSISLLGQDPERYFGSAAPRASASAPDAIDQTNNGTVG